MSAVLLLTDRPEFASRWSAACGAAGLTVLTRPTSEPPARLESGAGVIFDAESGGLADGALLPTVGWARARGAVAVVALPPTHAHAEDDLLAELCEGLIARAEGDVGRMVSALKRRCSHGRGSCFAHVSRAADGADLLAILDDGSATILARPLAASDDGSGPREVILASDGRSAKVVLESGAELELRATDLQAKRGQNNHGSEAVVPAALRDVDGVRLGQRLRALRLAAGLTQAELARRTGIHRPNIARVEAGRHTPSLETLARLAAAIGVSTTRVLAD